MRVTLDITEGEAAWARVGKEIAKAWANVQKMKLRTAKFKKCRNCVHPSLVHDIWLIVIFELLLSLQIEYRA